MGTRNLVAVQLKGKYRIAQYGQWDGYPSGQGATVLEFLAKWDRKKFEKKVRASKFCTKKNMTALQVELDATKDQVAFYKKYPQLTRDTGAKILQVVQDSESGIKLQNSIDFAGDSLFCEWAYVIDLDENTLEVYKGFYKGKVPDGERFAKSPIEAGSEYSPIKLAAKYSLDKLPTVEEIEKDCKYGE
jgi:hypothetical protein